MVGKCKEPKPFSKPSTNEHQSSQAGAVRGIPSESRTAAWAPRTTTQNLNLYMFVALFASPGQAFSSAERRYLARRAAFPCRWREPPEPAHAHCKARRATQGSYPCRAMCRNVSPSGLRSLQPWLPVVYITGKEMPPSGLKTTVLGV